MKRLYTVHVERGNRVDAWEYNVVASSDEEAVRKAKRQAREDSGFRTGWRTTMLAEKPERVVA